jgi:hypothetical protein
MVLISMSGLAPPERVVPSGSNVVVINELVYRTGQFLFSAVLPESLVRKIMPLGAVTFDNRLSYV